MQTLGQADFLKLLVAQMSSQDPLNPQSNTDFVAQMAQFSTLQASQSMQSSLSQINGQQQVLQANNLIGRNVTLLDNNGNPVAGTVAGVIVNNGSPNIVVNGQSYGLSTVISIAPSAVATTPSTSSSATTN